jgi:hypothetical protein
MTEQPKEAQSDDIEHSWSADYILSAKKIQRKIKKGLFHKKKVRRTVPSESLPM